MGATARDPGTETELSIGSRSTNKGVRPTLQAYAISVLASVDFPHSGGPTIITRGPWPVPEGSLLAIASSRSASSWAWVLTKATLASVSSLVYTDNSTPPLLSSAAPRSMTQPCQVKSAALIPPWAIVYVFPTANSHPYNSQDPFCKTKLVVPEAVLSVDEVLPPKVTSNRSSSLRCKTCRSRPGTRGGRPSVEVLSPPLILMFCSLSPL